MSSEGFLAGPVLVTGGNGFIGKALIRELNRVRGLHAVTSVDIRPVADFDIVPGITYEVGDILSPDFAALMMRVRPATVVHLASVVAVGGDEARDREIDVNGTRHVLRACMAAGVGHLIVTSSGAAYGYYADNPVPLQEHHPLRGNDNFPYARNKRDVEDMLARWRSEYKQLKQTVFRPCTVLGPATDNQITALFERAVVTGLSGTATPFSLIADTDVVGALTQAVLTGKDGVYNLAGSGTLTLREIARLNGKFYLPIPPAVMRAAIGIMQMLGLTKLSPDNVQFIQFRPVLDNRKLREEFGYVPRLNARAVFERYRDGRKERMR